MENIGWFSDFVTSYGVQQEYGFVTVDLYEKQNVPQVSITELASSSIYWLQKPERWEKRSHKRLVVDFLIFVAFHKRVVRQNIFIFHVPSFFQKEEMSDKVFPSMHHPLSQTLGLKREAKKTSSLIVG